MLTIALGVALTGVLLGAAGSWGRRHAADLGGMSHQWVAAYRASEPASSQ